MLRKSEKRLSLKEAIMPKKLYTIYKVGTFIHYTEGGCMQVFFDSYEDAEDYLETQIDESERDQYFVDEA